MLSVVMLRVVMLSVVMLSVVMLSVVMQGAVKLSILIQGLIMLVSLCGVLLCWVYLQGVAMLALTKLSVRCTEKRANQQICFLSRLPIMLRPLSLLAALTNMRFLQQKFLTR